MGSGVSLSLWPPCSNPKSGFGPAVASTVKLEAALVMINRALLLLCDTRFRPSSAERCGVVSSCELNTSLPWCLHTSSIKLVFYEYSKRSLFRDGFGLRCFQPLSAST